MVKIIYSLFFLVILLSSVSANDSFILNSIEETHKLSRITDKPALIIFGSDYCKFCTILKNDILNNTLSPDIDKYIICYVNISNHPEIKDAYKISVIPDSRVFIKQKQERIIKGYSKNNYIKWLNNDR